MRVLVTGVSGFVGRALYEHLLSEPGVNVRGGCRNSSCVDGLAGDVIRVEDFSSSTDFSEMLSGVSVVVHCAARVHVMKESLGDPLSEFRKVNVAASLNLARQAAQAGVKRFVFISSIKVNGESTQNGELFHADDISTPLDAYGVSKMEAEKELMSLSGGGGMEWVIIRPPLVYGAGAKGNFKDIFQLVGKGLILPLAGIRNKRSLVGIDNLVDFISCCIHHPAAANQVFLISDGEDVSTTELLQFIGRATGRPARLFSVPAGLLSFVAIVLGRKDAAQRLLGSLQVDVSKASALLGWVPPVSLEEGLRRCVHDTSA